MERVNCGRREMERVNCGRREMERVNCGRREMERVEQTMARHRKALWDCEPKRCDRQLWD
jgi:hypothetical protein